MKTLIMIFCAAAAAMGFADMNPVMWADVPDISICRKGDTYYMTSTSMHFNPGIPVMASKDLVNWKIVSYCYDTIENRDEDNLANGKNDYLYGTWASSIRYNEADGRFYVSSFNNRIDCTYLFRTDNIESGKRERYRINRKFYDHSLWIENGQISFVAAGGNKARLYNLSWDEIAQGRRPADEGHVVLGNIADCAPPGRGLGEGCQLFKRDGWYYLFNICWPAGHCRLVAVHRARSLEGPWEGRTVYECEGIAQGGIVDTPDGRWFAYLFGDRGGVGRIPYMIPIAWKDGWPEFPRDEKGAFTRPALEIPGVVKDSKPGCVEDDEFDYAENKLKLAWQFNHNPDAEGWSVTERPGWLRLSTSRRTSVAKDLLSARNTLTQRTFGPVCEGMTRLDYAGLKPGDVAGLALFQACYGFAGVEMTGKGPMLVLWHNGLDAKDRHASRPVGRPSKAMSLPLDGGDGKIWLKAVCDFRPWPEPSYMKIPDHEDAARFYFSRDGVKWEPLGEAMYLPYTIGHFTGYRFALFAYATRPAEGTAKQSYADFDFFRTSPAVAANEMLMSDGTNPVIKTTFTPDLASVVDGD